MVEPFTACKSVHLVAGLRAAGACVQQAGTGRRPRALSQSIYARPLPLREAKDGRRPATDMDSPRMRKRNIALIAHDNKKTDMLEWARFNRELLSRHELFATGTTGSILEMELGLRIHKFRSGPLGGDQQVGAKIVEGGIDLVVFFWDPLEPHPHDVDVKALLRIAVVYNVPIACNRSTADFLISSPLMNAEYRPVDTAGMPEALPLVDSRY